MKMSRRNLLAAGGSGAIIAMAVSIRSSWAQSPEAATLPDLIVHNAKVTTLQNSRLEAEAFAVRGERIIAVGSEAEIMALRAGKACDIHGHAHAVAWAADVPVADEKAFWGALGCSCWAV